MVNLLRESYQLGHKTQQYDDVVKLIEDYNYQVSKKTGYWGHYVDEKIILQVDIKLNVRNFEIEQNKSTLEKLDSELNN